MSSGSVQTSERVLRQGEIGTLAQPLKESKSLVKRLQKLSKHPPKEKKALVTHRMGSAAAHWYRHGEANSDARASVV